MKRQIICDCIQSACRLFANNRNSRMYGKWLSFQQWLTCKCKTRVIIDAAVLRVPDAVVWPGFVRSAQAMISQISMRYLQSSPAKKVKRKFPPLTQIIGFSGRSDWGWPIRKEQSKVALVAGVSPWRETPGS